MWQWIIIRPLLEFVCSLTCELSVQDARNVVQMLLYCVRMLTDESVAEPFLNNLSELTNGSMIVESKT